MCAGEYLINAQGEDVVAGIRTPEPIDRLAASLPAAYEDLLKNCALLEKHYKDMQVGSPSASRAICHADMLRQGRHRQVAG